MIMAARRKGPAEILALLYLVCFSSLLQVEGDIFSKEPQNQLVPRGSTADVIFECQAGSELTNSKYNWTKDGEMIQIGDHFKLYTGDLYISMPEDGDAGSYRCIIDSDEGIAVSNNADLKFQYLNQNQQPSVGDIKSPEHTGVMMECGDVDYSPEFGVYFAWEDYSTAAQIPPSDTHFISQNTGNLYLANPVMSDAKTYQCSAVSLWQVNNLRRRVGSDKWKLTLEAAEYFSAPTFFVTPEPVTYVALNGNTFIECFAWGNPTPSISWTKDGEELPVFAKTTKSGQLYFLDVTEKAEGTYKCTIENSEGSISASGDLVLQYAPIWTEEIKSEEYYLTSSFTWTCSAKAVPAATYSWYKNGKTIEEDSDITILISGEFASLTITDLKEKHIGIYQCVAANKLGNKVSSAFLDVKSYPPVISPPIPSLTQAARGYEATIPCTHTAAPTANVTWSRAGSGVLSVGKKYSISDDASLVIHDITDDDEGKYTCTLKNILGQDSSSGDLKVNDPTVLTKLPTDVSTMVGTTVDLVCDATHDASLPLVWVWLHDEKKVIDPLATHYEMHGGALMIKSVTSKESGTYECCAETKVGTPCASAVVSVTAPPDPPTGVAVTTSTSTTHGLTWNAPFDNHSPILSYTVEYMSTYDEEWQKATTDPSFVNVTECMVVDLLPYNDYFYRVYATNGLGDGEASKSSELQNTLKGEPTEAPSKISGGGGDIGQLVVKWEPLSEKYYGSDYIQYVVAIQKIPEGGDGVHLPLPVLPSESPDSAEATDEGWKETTIFDGSKSNHTFKVEESEVYAPYNVKIKAINDVGEGPWSRTHIVHTFEIAPVNKPTNIRLPSQPEAYVAWLAWDELVSDNGRVAGYRVKLIQQVGGNAGEEVLYDTDSVQPRIEIEKLDANTLYQVYVAGYNSAGQGPWSDPFTFNTSKKPPSIPPKVKSVSIKNLIISAEWEPIIYEDQPLLDEAKLLGYKVEYWWSNRTSEFAEVKQTTETKIKVEVANNSQYNMWIRGYSAGGKGTPSMIYYLSTQSTAQPGYIQCCGANTITLNSLFVVLVTVLWMLFIKLDL